MDAAPPAVQEEPPARDWSLLPLDVLCSVFVMVGAVDVLMGAGIVCRSWLDAAKLPDVWRVVDMENHVYCVLPDKRDYVLAMAKAAVDRSDGQLRVFAGKYFVTEELMMYIVVRSPSLTTLRVVSCYGVISKRLACAIGESPLIELRSIELDLVYHDMGDLIDFLENCRVLEVLRVRNCFLFLDRDEHALRSKFAWIKTITLEWDGEYFCDLEIENEDFDHVPDFEEE